MNELLRTHLGTLEDHSWLVCHVLLFAGQDSLGHFPLLPSMKQFRSSLGAALEKDPRIQQADVPLGRKILILAALICGETPQPLRLLCGEPAFVCALLTKLEKTAAQQSKQLHGAHGTRLSKEKPSEFRSWDTLATRLVPI